MWIVSKGDMIAYDLDKILHYVIKSFFSLELIVIPMYYGLQSF